MLGMFRKKHEEDIQDEKRPELDVFGDVEFWLPELAKIHISRATDTIGMTYSLSCDIRVSRMELRVKEKGGDFLSPETEPYKLAERVIDRLLEDQPDCLTLNINNGNGLPSGSIRLDDALERQPPKRAGTVGEFQVGKFSFVSIQISPQESKELIEMICNTPEGVGLRGQINFKNGGVWKLDGDTWARVNAGISQFGVFYN